MLPYAYLDASALVKFPFHNAVAQLAGSHHQPLEAAGWKTPSRLCIITVQAELQAEHGNMGKFTSAMRARQISASKGCMLLLVHTTAWSCSSWAYIHTR